MIAEEDWAKLLSGGQRGTSRRRLHPDASPDLFLAVGFPGERRILVLVTDTATATSFVQSGQKLPQTKGMEIGFVPSSPGEHELQLVLTDDNLHEVFSPLVADIAEAVANDAGDRSAVRVFVSRFRRWVQLLDSVRSSGLSATDRRGLFGELTVLADLIDLGVPSNAAVTSWTGPNNTNQDFEIADGALEVKTTAGRSKKISVASERQLDDTGLSWLLLAHIVVDERRGGTGQSLNDLVADLLRRLDTADRDLLWSRLVAFGYLPAQQEMYAEPRYTLRGMSLFDVSAGFPRIIENNLPNGVTDCAYQLDLAALEHWSRKPGILRSRVVESSGEEASNE